MPHEEDTVDTTMATLEQLDEKISDLAAMVARGFSEIRSEMATKEDIREIIERIDAIERKFDTRTDFLQDQHDALATRTKDLEKAVLS